MTSEQDGSIKNEPTIIQTTRTGKFIIRQPDGTLKQIEVVAKVKIPITK